LHFIQKPIQILQIFGALSLSTTPVSEAGRVFDCYNDTGEEFLTGINDAYEASGYVIDSDYVVRTTFQEKPVKSRL
jgi:hypothetical protein